MSSTAALLAIVLLLLILAGVAAATFGRYRRSSRRRGRRGGASRTGGPAMYDGSSIDPAAASAAPPPTQEPPPTDVDAAGAPVFASPADVYGMDDTDAQQATRQPRAAADPQSQYPATQQPGIWDTTQSDDFRRRWNRVESRFVQDPPGSVTEARQLVDEAVKALAETVQSREEQLERGSARASDSIADMRESVLQYHRLLDRLLSV